MSGDRPSADSASRTPDRIAADALIARAESMERSGYPEAAQELRRRADRLLGIE